MHATILDISSVLICRRQAIESPAGSDDFSLVRRIRAGDQVAFRELVERHQSKIFGVICGILRNRQDAEEIAQEVFAKVYFSIGSFHHRGSLAAWIHRIAVNQCYAHLRKRRVSLVYEGPGIDLNSAADGRPTADRALAERDFVNHLLARMPEDDRALLLGKEVEGLSVSELAETTGLKENTIKVRLFRPAEARGAGRPFIEMRGNMRLQSIVLVALLIVAGSRAAEPSRGRERLEREVRHELVMLPFYGVFDNFAFQVDGYNVTLLGQVTRPVLKTDAERVVKRIEGVESVTNRIEVLPLSPNDDRIRIVAYRAIYGYSALNRYALMAVPSIHIIVKNGDVTLEGAVAREADKNIANIQANSVPGVFSVTNNLRVNKEK